LEIKNAQGDEPGRMKAKHKLVHEYVPSAGITQIRF